ncbi:MAG: pseudouridine synthase [Crocinitomicaceae bacterium]|nr:pseudouridine synthase [Crocinitomicaceae bacterium]
MSNHRHFIVYKPYGFLSQFIYNGKRKAKKGLLGSLHDFPEGTMSIGRLDEDSEGLLMLTTDGKMSQHIRSKKIEKEYFVQVDGVITEEAVDLLITGVTISVDKEKYLTKPCEARLINDVPNFPERARKIRDDRHGPTSWASVTLTEGKFRQVRKMTAAVGFPTLRLVRVRIAEVHLNDLDAGGVLELSEEEIR